MQEHPTILHAYIVSTGKTKAIIDMANRCAETLKPPHTPYESKIYLIDTVKKKIFCLVGGDDIQTYECDDFSYNTVTKIAINNALACDTCKYVIVSNDDVIYHRHSIDEMIDGLKSTGALSTSPIEECEQFYDGYDNLARWEEGRFVAKHIKGWSILFNLKAVREINRTRNFDDYFPDKLKFWFVDNYYADCMTLHGDNHVMSTRAISVHLREQSHSTLTAEDASKYKEQSIVTYLELRNELFGSVCITDTELKWASNNGVTIPHHLIPDFSKSIRKENVSGKKIAVYSICKNEIKMVDRYLESIKDADCIIVCDTGSTDGTIDLLNERKHKYPQLEVYQISIVPWRFDAARNTAMYLVPSDVDICVKLDLDEVMVTGWYGIVQNEWDNDINRLWYLFNDQGSEYNASWIHARNSFQWKYAVHEYVSPVCGVAETSKTIQNTLTVHAPDNNVGRDSYLPMLITACREESIPRHHYYLAREYYYRGDWDNLILIAEKYLTFKKDFWYAEKMDCMIMLSKAYVSKGKRREAIKILIDAHQMAYDHREPSWHLARLYYNEKDFSAALYWISVSLEIKSRQNHIFNSLEAWGGGPSEIKKICIEEIKKAISNQ